MIVSILLILLIVAVLIGLNALYVAGEFAAVSARKTRITQMAEQGSRMARLILPILEDHHRLDNYIAASQVGITISSLLLGIYGQQQIAPLLTPLFARPFGGEAAAAGISAALVLIVLTTLQVVFGELLPKSIALQYPEKIALGTAVPMKWSADIILKPLIVLLNGSGRLIMRLLGLQQAGGHAHIHSPEEIVFLVSESHKGGLLDADKRRMLRSAFHVSEMTAAEVATPRTRLVTAQIEEPVETVLQRAAGSAFTRLPVYDEDIDDIVGFVHLRDLFTLHENNPGSNLRAILRPVPFLPETVHLTEVRRTLVESGSYLVILFDEYGGTSGLITWEDLVEEVFGELQDEFDLERQLMRPAGEGRVVVRGDMRVEQLSDLLDLDLPRDVSYTIGGLLLDRLGRVPEVGDRVVLDGVELAVDAVMGRTITSVQVTLPPGEKAQPGEAA